MQSHSSPSINFLETVDSYLIYAIGNKVFQVEVTAENLVDFAGIDYVEYETPFGRCGYDEVARLETLDDVHESDYVPLIEYLMSKSEDITQDYESPVTPFEKQLCDIAAISTEPAVQEAIRKLLFETRL